MAIGTKKIENALIGGTAVYVKENGGLYTALPIQTTSTVTAAGIVNAGTSTITAASANAFAVGATGTTNPQFNVDTSVSSVATGLNIQGKAAGSGLAISVVSSGTNENATLDAKGTGTITINGVGGGAVVVGTTGAPSRLSIVSNGSNAIAVGPAGSINPTLQVDASTASAVTGLKVKSAAAAGGLALSVISSGTNESLTIDTKGTGTITLQSGTAVPAAGSAAASVRIGTSGPGVFVGSGAPTVSAPQGSIYLRTDGSSSSTRAYINSDGATTWVAVTTAS